MKFEYQSSKWKETQRILFQSISAEQFVIIIVMAHPALIGAALKLLSAIFKLSRLILQTSKIYYSGDAIQIVSPHKLSMENQIKEVMLIEEKVDHFITDACYIEKSIYKHGARILAPFSPYVMSTGESVYNNCVTFADFIKSPLKAIEKPACNPSDSCQSESVSTPPPLLLEDKRENQYPEVDINEPLDADVVGLPVSIRGEQLHGLKQVAIPNEYETFCQCCFSDRDTFNCKINKSVSKNHIVDKELIVLLSTTTKSRVSHVIKKHVCPRSNSPTRIKIKTRKMIHLSIVESLSSSSESAPIPVFFTCKPPPSGVPIRVRGEFVIDETHQMVFVADTFNEMAKQEKPFNAESFNIFQTALPLSLVRSIQQHRLKIRGDAKNDGVLADLICLHSVREIWFDGELIPGSVQALHIGDSGVAKSKQKKGWARIVESIPFIDGGSASRAGITYTIEQNKYGKYIRFGKLAKADGCAAIIDEIQNLPEEERRKLRSIRSERKVVVTMSCQQERACHVRLFILCNPAKCKRIEEFEYGALAIGTVFEPADIRRFDIAIVSMAEDVSLQEANKANEETKKEPDIVSEAVLKQHIQWAWSLGSNRILIPGNCVGKIYQSATYLQEKYQAANDIPLVAPDMHHKLARLVTGYAVFRHSVNSEGRVEITPEHVSFVTELLDRLYSGKGFKLDAYASIRKKTVLVNEDFERIYTLLFKKRGKRQDNESTRRLIECLIRNNTIKRQKLMDKTKILKDSFHRRMKILQKEQLVINTWEGYSITPKMRKFYQQLKAAKL